MPPIILGRLGSDPGKKTVCIYGHLDVQPANIDDGWDTEPFELVEKDGEKKTLWFLFGFKFRRQDSKVLQCWMSCYRNALSLCRKSHVFKIITLGFLLQACVICLTNAVH